MINANVRGRITGADEHDRRRHARFTQQGMKVRSDGLKGSWRRAQFAPAIPCAIIPARASVFRNLTLNGDPTVAGLMTVGVEDNRRAALAQARNVQRSSTYVYRLPDLFVAVPIWWRPISSNATPDRPTRAKPRQTCLSLLALGFVISAIIAWTPGAPSWFHFAGASA